MAVEGGDSGAQPLADAHRALLSDHAYQFDFPAYRPSPSPDWMRALAELFTAASPALKYLFWAGLALAVGLLLFLIGRELIRVRWPARKRAAAEDALARPDEHDSAALLAEADRLAAEGRYDEAAHLLLFRTILDLGQREPALVRPPLTSRDIAAIPTMPERARSRFAEIAAVVERSFFAGRAIGAPEFTACRDAYRAFAAAEAWA